MHSRHFLPSCLAIGLTLFAISGAFAQQSTRKPNSTNSQKSLVEQTARTRWQPTRPQPGAASAGSSVRQTGNQVPARGVVRRTQASGELPAPPQPKPLPQSETGGSVSEVPLVDLGAEGYEVPMHGERSVMNGGSTSRSMQSGQALDGEIIYDSDPYISDSFAGDVEGGYSHGSEGCSCGGTGCDSGSCDSMGCSGQASCGCRTCNARAWRPCITLCFPQDGWASFEYLGWNQRGMNLPPLVTRSDVGTTRPNAGVLGLSTTDILFGGGSVLDDGFNGGRLQFGFWLDRCHLWGVGAEYFELGEESVSFSQTSAGNPILARPFFNATTGRQDAELVAFPNALSGTVTAQATSQLTGAGFHFRRQTNSTSGCHRDWFCGGTSTVQSRTDLLFGYRYIQLDESVSVNENLVGAPSEPGRFLINDRFDTINQFNGFDVGILYNRRRGLWSLDVLGKLALGNTRQSCDINGSTSIDGAAPLTGGLLAQTSNIGMHQRDRFTFVPELGATVGYSLTPHFKLKAGYTVIMWSSVLRPGDQIDLDINPNLLPPTAVPFTGPQRPAFQFDDSDYYVQGVNLGAELNW